MANLIRNASFLDGVTDWTRTSTGVLTTFGVDETVRGSPGRAALRGAGVSTANNQTAVIHPATASRVAVTPGEVLTASAWFWSSVPGAYIALQFYTAAAAALGAPVALPTVQAQGTGKRGLPGLFGRGKGKVAVPATAATVGLRVMVTVPVSGTAIELVILKPHLAKSDAAQCWSPGPHTAVDLQLASWPDTLPQLRSIDSPRTPTRRGFETDSRIPSAWRVAPVGRVRLTGEMKLDLEQRDALLEFHKAVTLAGVVTPFWFMNPDTHELNRAWFDPDDGDPQDSGAGAERRTRVGLILELA